ncbi:MAG: putative esterase [Rhodothermales bacterium]|jgi:predicted esterase
MSDSPKPSHGSRAIAALLRVLILPWVFGIGALALLLAIVAESAGGGLCGLGFLSGSIGITVLLAVWGLDWRRARILGLVAIILGMGFLAASASLSPSGKTAEDAGLQSTFGTRGFCRYSVASLVPEIDQFTLGSYLVPLLDPYINHAQSVRIRSLFQGVYRELRKDPDFAEAGSVMNYAYRDTFGVLPHESGHQYCYIPAWRDEAYPVLIFMHGSGGNFKGYMWVLKSLADTHGVAIVAPSLGMGTWPKAETEACIREALAVCASDPRLDENRVFLAGLSNGGIALSHSAPFAEALRGFIGISPVLHREPFADSGFHAAWSGKPVLLLHGGQDRRIPQSFVDAAGSSMSRGGVSVTTRIFESEDHFLFFSQPDKVLDTIANWMAE